MTTIKAQIPDYLARLAEEVAEKEGITVDQIVALALSAQVSAWNVRDDIETRAKRGSAEKLGTILAKAPDRAPLPADKL